MRVGVTGIYSSGKGTVCSMFKELGAIIIDTDLIAHDIVRPGEPGHEAIIRSFGRKFLRPDNTLDRRAFGQYIFKSTKRVKKLNSITHPLILETVLKESSGNRIYMVNTPLLFESGFDQHMDKTIVVRATDDQVIKRGMHRDNITKKEIQNRLKFQIPLNEKEKLADYIIDNTGPLELTKRQVSILWNTLKIIT